VSAPATIELDAQYRQLREECGVLERSARGKLQLSGAGATEFLQGQLTNDIEALMPGAGCYSALLDRKGHMQADMRVLALADGAIWIDTEAEALERVRRHLDTYKIGRAVELEDMTSSRAIISLIGPASESVAGTAAGPEHSQRAVTIGGADCVAVVTGGGIDLICEAEAAAAVRSALLAAGAAEVSDEAAEIVRVESGVPASGSTSEPRRCPPRPASSARAVSFTKGCYIGQETVARLHYRGRPEPPSPRAAPERRRRARRPAAPRREGGRPPRQLLRLSALRPDRDGGRAPRGRAGGPPRRRRERHRGRGRRASLRAGEPA
jgi:folate-binding protein YgfZ